MTGFSTKAGKYRWYRLVSTRREAFYKRLWVDFISDHKWLKEIRRIAKDYVERKEGVDKRGE